MRKQLGVVALLMLLFAGLGSSALLTRALAQPKTRTAIQQEKLIGPKPIPRWYWRWVQWRLGEGYAKTHPLRPNLRPKHAPRHIPSWAWRRLHFFLLARDERVLANGGNKGHHGHTTTSSPTTTSTTTTSATSTSSTTTGTTTTTSGGSTTFDQAIAYTQTRPAFTPIRTIDVTSASQLKSAVANLQAGDLVQATANFTLSAGGSGDALAIQKKLSSPAVIDLSGVSIIYTGGYNYPAVSVMDSSNIRIYGGDLSTDSTGGVCLELMASSYITWWGFTAHDCGSTGLRMMTGKTGYSNSGPVEHDDIQGEIWKFGQNPNWSTHTEKCTGLHGANIADGNYYPVAYNRIALYVHDSACEGAGIEFGSSQSTNIPTNNTIILKAANLSYVSTLQTGGNCYQTWGYGVTYTDIKYLECDNVMGHAYFAGGLYNKPNGYLSSDTVDHGGASNTNQNPRYASDPVWDQTGGTVYQDVQPAP